MKQIANLRDVRVSTRTNYEEEIFDGGRLRASSLFRAPTYQLSLEVDALPERTVDDLQAYKGRKGWPNL